MYMIKKRPLCLTKITFQDVVIHVRDASHPDYELQGITVNETLSSLPLSEDTPVITVANKADLTLVKPENEFGEHMLSATTGKGKGNIHDKDVPYMIKQWV